MASEVEQIITELKKLESKIEKRFDSVDKELSAIKDDIRKINQFVPMENADFRVHVSQTNGKPKKEVPKKKRVATK